MPNLSVVREYLAVHHYSGPSMGGANIDGVIRADKMLAHAHVAASQGPRAAVAHLGVACLFAVLRERVIAEL